jgi:hypothetical protein
MRKVSIRKGRKAGDEEKDNNCKSGLLHGNTS